MVAPLRAHPPRRRFQFLHAPERQAIDPAPRHCWLRQAESCLPVRRSNALGAAKSSNCCRSIDRDSTRSTPFDGGTIVDEPSSIDGSLGQQLLRWFGLGQAVFGPCLTDNLVKQIEFGLLIHLFTLQYANLLTSISSVFVTAQSIA